MAVSAARRAAWLKTLHQWHWVSAGTCLVGMLLFAFTGLTLNNASQIEGKPAVTVKEAQLPDALRARLGTAGEGGAKARAALPPPVRDWLSRELAVALDARDAEWSADEIYLSLPRPGGDAWLRIERRTGAVEYERSDRGWISYLNDLHKGRHTGAAWSWFIDIFAAATLVFSVTGLFILKMHAGNRPFTWPMVGMGMVVPVLLALLFIH